MLHQERPAAAWDSTSAMPRATALPELSRQSPFALPPIRQAQSRVRAAPQSQVLQAMTAQRPQQCLPSSLRTDKQLLFRLKPISSSSCCPAARELLCPCTVLELECPGKILETRFPP